MAPPKKRILAAPSATIKNFCFAATILWLLDRKNLSLFIPKIQEAHLAAHAAQEGCLSQEWRHFFGVRESIESLQGPVVSDCIISLNSQDRGHAIGVKRQLFGWLIFDANQGGQTSTLEDINAYLQNTYFGEFHDNYRIHYLPV